MKKVRVLTDTHEYNEGDIIDVYSPKEAAKFVDNEEMKTQLMNDPASELVSLVDVEQLPEPMQLMLMLMGGYEGKAPLMINVNSDRYELVEEVE